MHFLAGLHSLVLARHHYTKLLDGDFFVYVLLKLAICDVPKTQRIIDGELFSGFSIVKNRGFSFGALDRVPLQNVFSDWNT